ncbi:MAG: RdgB/HAM1 family non-canonical purine NTP pyrophosphatase [Pirellulales bacterium]
MELAGLLVLGTGNRKKARELVDLLTSVGLQIETLADFPSAIEVEETGDSFAANAALKATQQARHLGQWVLAEDSGIVVDALDGRPGIFSARYAGPGATDQQNNEKLLAELGDTPLADRTAHYVCHMVLADRTGDVRAQSSGQCHGRIRFEPAGAAGFGYDPLFEIVETHRTCAELGDIVKSVLSHRARAAEQMIPRLMELVDTGQWQS